MKYFIKSELEIKRLGNNIKMARERRGLNVSELATNASVSRTVLLRIERGDPTVGIAKVFNILEALGLLSGISSFADPELDRAQALKELKDLREKVSNKTMVAKKQFTKTDLDF